MQRTTAMRRRTLIKLVSGALLAAGVGIRSRISRAEQRVSFPILEGVTREIAERIGAWWEERRGIIQPSEFILDSTGKILTSTYSSGPVGRIPSSAAVSLIEFYESK